MSFPRALRRAAVLTAVTALAAPLVGSSPAPASESRPTNAGKVFRWGLEAWEEEAEHKHLDNRWKSNHPKVGRSQ